MIFCFVVKTMASMAARKGREHISYLDVAKSVLESFVKARALHANSGSNDTSSGHKEEDVFMLVCCDAERPIRCGRFGTCTQFLQETKTLTATHTLAVELAVAHALAELNRYRMQGWDNFGRGRMPWLIEPTCIIVLADEIRSPTTKGDEDAFLERANAIGGGCDEFFSRTEPYRWDQRLFWWKIQLPSILAASKSLEFFERATSVPNILSRMVEDSGGRVSRYDRLDAIMHASVAFAKLAAAGVTCRLCTQAGKRTYREFIPVTKAGLWPIPESFPCQKPLRKLPIRPAIPTILIEKSNSVFVPPPAFRADRYILMQSHLTAALLRNPEASSSWHLYMKGSKGASTKGAPFGMLVLHDKHVVLVLLPYDFVRLADVVALTDIQQRQTALRKYMHHIPRYYRDSTLAVLERLGMTQGVADVIGDGIHISLSAHIGHLRAQADVQYRKDHHHHQLQQQQQQQQQRGEAKEQEKEQEKEEQDKQHAHIIGDPLTRKRKYVSLSNNTASPYLCCDPLMVRREDLLDTLDAFGTWLQSPPSPPPPPPPPLSPLLSPARRTMAHTVEKNHSLPIAEMGDYLTKLQSQEVFRDPLLSDEQQQQQGLYFGSPYRRRSSSANTTLQIDEADVSSPNVPKRTHKRHGPRLPFPLIYIPTAKGSRTRSLSSSPPASTLFSSSPVLPMPGIWDEKKQRRALYHFRMRYNVPALHEQLGALLRSRHAANKAAQFITKLETIRKEAKGLTVFFQQLIDDMIARCRAYQQSELTRLLRRIKH